MAALLERVKAKMRSVDNALTKEEKAAREIRKATTRAELERARADLRAARMERLTKEIEARAALETARADLNLAKTRQIEASTAKWGARRTRISALLGGATTSGAAKTTGRALARTAKWLWGEQKPTTTKRRIVRRKPAATKRTTTTKRKTTAKRRTTSRR
ncbi:MAG: hypothetical protein PHQ43_00745 [Dehalococcoidales bacterium]|nr:hypothetical protein [Dehalococcoidales bacterium]